MDYAKELGLMKVFTDGKTKPKLSTPMLIKKESEIEVRVKESKNMREGQSKKPSIVLLSTLLIFLILFSMASIEPLVAASYNGDVVWERDFGVNIDGFAVADEKVFVTTHAADLYCLDQKNGEILWQYNFGPLAGGGFLTAPVIVDGKVFVGSRGSKLAVLGENTGVLLWEFQPNVNSSTASKSPPYFTIMDGKAFTTGDGFYVLNATDGKLMWESTGPNRFGGPWVVANGRVLMGSIGDLPTYDWYLNSLNADDGTVLWTYKVFTFLESSPVVADGRVLVWDRWQNQTMLCLDEASGDLLWQFDVDGQASEPVLSDEMVFFGALQTHLFTKEVLYALDVGNGKLLPWMSELGTQNFRLDDITVHAQIVVKVIGDRVYAGYTISESGDNQNAYEGYVYSYNRNGNRNWRTPISNFASSGGGLKSITQADDALYVISSNDLYRLNADNGQIEWVQTFTYWVLPPIYACDKLFVAADLKVIAYGEASQAPINSIFLIALTTIVALVATAVIAAYWLRKKHRKNNSKANV